MRRGVPERADVVAGQLRVTEKPPASITEGELGKSLGFLFAIFTTPGCVRLQVLAGSGGIVVGLVKTESFMKNPIVEKKELLRVTQTPLRCFR